MNRPPVCADCQHFWHHYRIARPPTCDAIKSFSPVWGDIIDSKPCKIHRSKEGACGPEGRLFEQKKTLWIILKELLGKVIKPSRPA